MLMVQGTFAAVKHVVKAEAWSEIESTAAESQLVRDCVLDEAAGQLWTIRIQAATDLLGVCHVAYRCTVRTVRWHVKKVCSKRTKLVSDVQSRKDLEQSSGHRQPNI